MTDKDNSPHIAALQELEAALKERQQAVDPARQGTGRAVFKHRRWRRPALPAIQATLRKPLVRRLAIGVGAFSAVTLLACGALVWRLSSGPISLDLATPWLTAAIEENLGSRYRIQVGGTQLERDAQGRTRVRLRDIVVLDVSGAAVAAAPKAEVGIAGTSLLVARPRAESFRLVDARMLIRIEPDGRVDVFAGGERPFASFSPGIVAAAPVAPGAFSLQSFVERSAAANLAALLAWLDGVGGLGGDGRKLAMTGFDGYELSEIGITNASLTIEDRRISQERNFNRINLSLIRPKDGGVAFSIGSENHDRPWQLHAALTPRRQGHRLLQVVARKVLLDDLLAMRMAEAGLRSDTLLSASVESDIGPDGTPQIVGGTIIAEGGSIGDGDDPVGRIPITSVELRLDWDISRRTLRMPFKIVAGSTRVTLGAEFAPPAAPGGNWMFLVGGGWILLDPVSPDDEVLALKRVLVRGQIDTAKQRLVLEQADFGTKEFGSLKEAKDVSVAFSGTLDYGDEPRLAVGLAGSQMSVAALKRLWPTLVAPKVRDWVVQHLVSGTVERIDIATNAPLASLRVNGPPIPDDGLSVDIVTSATALRPVDNLPVIRDADLTARIAGRSATVSVGKGTIEVSPGRRLSLSNGVFEVPDMSPAAPPARVRFRLDGSVPAAAELLALERLRDFSGVSFDPTTSRGTLSAQINLALPLQRDLPKGSTNYNIAVDLSNFVAEKMLLGQKVEATALRITANNQSYQIKGDVKVNGTPALLEYRKLRGAADSELRMQASLDDAARARLGLDLGPTVAGALPIKLNGRMGSNDRESRFNVEADLTPVKIDNLLPGWIKPAGKPARATFLMIKDKNTTRFDDLLVDGSGVLAKGTVEVDSKGDVQSANFPVFATSDGDKTTLKADRGPDGALRVTMRGDVYDGRNFAKSSMGGPSDPNIKQRHPDLDLDIKLGVVAGHNGEALRGLDFRMSRRAGRVRNFTLAAKIGRDTPLVGDLRQRASNKRQVLVFETNDAGALFRFTDMYARMVGGKMSVVMDSPTQDLTPQEGTLTVRDFSVRGEGALDRVVSDSPNNARNNIEFSQASAEFTRTPGRMTVREGVVRGPIIGATMEGNIDYARDEMHMRGTLVPLYGINNIFGQIPIVGLFLGGSNEGLLGITYEVTGSTSNPRSQVNPLSAIAPGLLRKLFEFRENTGDRSSFVDPIR